VIGDKKQYFGRYSKIYLNHEGVLIAIHIFPNPQSKQFQAGNVGLSKPGGVHFPDR
jgi:hypothetical protein